MSGRNIIYPADAPDIYNISGSHGDEQITLLAVGEQIILNLIKGRKYSQEFPVPEYASADLQKKFPEYRFLLLHKYPQLPHDLPG